VGGLDFSPGAARLAFALSLRVQQQHVQQPCHRSHTMRTEQQQRTARERVARTRSRARTVASAAVPCRMADVASACRRTTRASQQPPSLAEEQAESTCSAMQPHTPSAVLLLSSASRGKRQLLILPPSAVSSCLSPMEHNEQRSDNPIACTLERGQVVPRDAHNCWLAALPLLACGQSTLTRCAVRCAFLLLCCCIGC